MKNKRSIKTHEKKLKIPANIEHSGVIFANDRSCKKNMKNYYTKENSKTP